MLSDRPVLPPVFLAPGCLMLAACTTTAQDSLPVTEREVGSTGECDAAGVQNLLGRQADAALGAQIKRKTGASVFQWVPPDSAVTMDYRQDRVRVSYDREMAITVIRCG